MSNNAVLKTSKVSASERVVARELTLGDIPALMQLESLRWNDRQAARADDLARRIQTWPTLSLGCFSRRSGEARASLFMRPIDPDDVQRLPDWAAMVNAPWPRDTRSLFGISFTSVDADAGDALFRFFWPRALRDGWKDIFLGAPMPGYAAAAARQPGLCPEHYARQTHRGIPTDPQLRYFRRRGFTDLVAVKPGYFPHDGSLDYGVMLRGAIPLAGLGWLWRRLSPATVQSLVGHLAHRPS